MFYFVWKMEERYIANVSLSNLSATAQVSFYFQGWDYKI